MIARLAYKQSKAQWRRSDWRALLVSLFLMTSLITLLSLTGDRLQNSLVLRSAEVLGADMIISSSRPLDDELRKTVADSGLASTEVTQFSTVVEAGDAILLSSIRAVSPPYPMRGEIVTQPPLPSSATANERLPSPGNVWVEQSVLDRLGVNVGDTINIGYAPLVIDRLIMSSPDRGSGFRSFNPQVIMRSEDLAATQVISPGSRVRYRLLLAGDTEAVANLDAALKPTLKTWQRAFTAQGDQPVSRNAIGNAGQYLKLSALFALLLGGFSIFLSLRRFSADQQHRTALLLSLGLSRQQLMQLFGLQLFSGWLIAAIPGMLLGLGLHYGVMNLLSGLLPQPLPSLSMLMLLSSPLLAAAILLVLGLPTLLPLSQISVMTLLRQDSANNTHTPKWVQLVTPLLLFGLMSLFVESLLLAALMTAGLLLIGWLSGYAVQWLIQQLNQRLKHRIRLFPLLTLRIRQQRHWHRLQGGVLTLLLTLMSVLFFARQDLLNDWEQQLPADTPNNFVINIQPWERDQIDTWLNEHDVSATLYPMIRGRVTTINGVLPEEILTPEQQDHNTLNRELNLTWGTGIPAHNTLEAGEWSSDNNAISIEKSMADELGLVLGDELGFQVGSDTFTGTITSVRGVEWTSFQPNFYVVFSPGVINDLPATYITSFRLTPEQKPYSAQLVKAFPTLTLIDVEQLLNQAQDLINKLSDSASFIMLLTVLSGLLLVVVTLQQDLAKRRFEVALLRTLGASMQQAQWLDRMEYILMGFSCGVVAAVMSEALLLGIYWGPLDLPPAWHPWLWISLPLLATVLFALTGSLIRRGLSLPRSYQLLKSHD